MKYDRRAILLAVLCFLLLLAVGAVALAQSSAGFNLEWHVVAGGGGESSSASYRVDGSIGQSLAGPPPAAGSAFAVTGGYWVFDSRRSIHLPVLFKQ